MASALHRAMIAVMCVGVTACSSQTSGGRDSIASRPETIRVRDAARPAAAVIDSTAAQVFSTMLYNEESGDVSGYEVSLRKVTDTGRWLATYQNADGNSGHCDTLSVTGSPGKFAITLKPAYTNDGKEIYPSWPLDGVIRADTLHAILHMRWPSGDSRVDTLAIPRVQKAYFRACTGEA